MKFFSVNAFNLDKVEILSSDKGGIIFTID